MSSTNKHRNLASTALAYLEVRAGLKFSSSEIAEAIGVDARQMRNALEKLNRAGSVRIDADVRPKTYFVPTAEQKAELDKPVKTKPFRTYRVPQPMVDLMARINIERDRYPSHYYGQKT